MAQLQTADIGIFCQTVGPSASIEMQLKKILGHNFIF
jgi:hypothetical protein